VENNNKREIVKTWLTGKHSCTLIIPRFVAKEYGLDEPSHVVVEGTNDGILIKKLEL
jgi:antitoxin component of MazEF toxin-antitoxin module